PDRVGAAGTVTPPEDTSPAFHLCSSVGPECHGSGAFATDSPQIHEPNARAPLLAPGGALTTVGVPHNGDHRELLPPPLPPQETPLLPQSLQRLPHLHFLFLQEALLHL
ncbi:unnamed protein product, partial [Gulo gulo]